MNTTTKQQTTIASLFALLLGSGMTVILHEGAHWVTGAALGVPSRLYSFAVDHGSGMTPSQTARSDGGWSRARTGKARAAGGGRRLVGHGRPRHQAPSSEIREVNQS
ncbi:MAG: hypothetical protein KF875_12600 [Trueperaceae bacterium]|nr:hypothetical protein [Trueperaceae bacterium]MCW5819044.1 hypothetical protein [Trueperaceae bacterium]